MPTYRFEGRVLPPNVKITIPEPFDVHWEDEEGLVTDIRFTITNSNVTVTSKANRLAQTQAEFAQIYIRAYDLARTVINCFAYVNGFGLTVSFESIIHPDGRKGFAFTEMPNLARRVSTFDLRPENEDSDRGFVSLFKIVMSDIPLMMAFHDLIESIHIPHVALVNCGRVMDMIRGSMIVESKKDKGWDTLRKNLQLSEPYVRSITDPAVGPRHADRGEVVSQAAYDQILERTWSVMDRFLAFRRGGRIALLVDDFPIM